MTVTYKSYRAYQSGIPLWYAEGLRAVYLYDGERFVAKIIMPEMTRTELEEYLRVYVDNLLQAKGTHYGN